MFGIRFVCVLVGCLMFGIVFVCVLVVDLCWALGLSVCWSGVLCFALRLSVSWLWTYVGHWVRLFLGWELMYGIGFVCLLVW